MRRSVSLAKIAVTMITLTLVLVPALSGSTPARAQQTSPEPPDLEAQAWALTDAETGLYLAGKNPDKRLPVASTTKIMVALLTLEKGVNLNEEVTISREAESYVGFTYSNVGLIAGERVAVRDLLVATLVPSGTDAVYALAEHLGGGSVDNFVEEMNAKAESMGLENTHFTNPAGLDDRNNYSSARDLAAIAQAAMEYPLFAEIVGREEATISTDTREIQVVNTNHLLYTYDEATGVKTGTSPEAGPCLVASATEDNESYITVILDAADEEYRFEAAQTALGYGFDAYERRPLVESGEVYRESPLPYRPEESVELAAAKDVIGPEGSNLEIERRVTERELPPEAEAGRELGSIELLINGQSIGNSPLVAQRGYERASLWQKIRYWTGNMVEGVAGWIPG